jgi:hypothetical protein
MAVRNVYKVKKDDDGDIIALCNSGEYWSPRSKSDVIDDIDNETHSYYSKGKAKIIVVDGENGKYLRTVPDASADDNLDNLPEC